jgi:3',5'-cyclic AMP phosphodiesterase CpdA
MQSTILLYVKREKWTGSARFLAAIAAAVLLVSCAASPGGGTAFVLAADMRNFVAGPSFFEGACDSIKATGAGDFMISPGDIDPPDDVWAAVKSRIGASYPWLPVVGNHEIDTLYSAPHPFAASIEWLRTYPVPFAVRPGPPGAATTCYSFDRDNVHIAVINEYYNGTDDNTLVGGHGYISPALLAWLDADLAAANRAVTFVVGHEPAYPQPDADPPYRVRHVGESLDADPSARDAFWSVLRARNVKAYLCGHTHDFSVVMINGVWQIDSGHARGTGDTGAPSTFVKMKVTPAGSVSWEAWRLDLAGGSYLLTHSGVL